MDFWPLVKRKKTGVEEGEHVGDKGDRSSCLTGEEHGEFLFGKRAPSA